ncbi:hypothetical protein [Ascidiimonas sp. W6]|uniref:hypothetical protein n=1 Tax=Ascidiimonas meishanensis TaxID=3128903 RepID=UPI0030EF0C6B
MIKEFIRNIGVFNFMMIILVLVTIVIAEALFLSGDKLHGIFVGLWAPTILGFMNYFKYKK